MERPATLLRKRGPVGDSSVTGRSARHFRCEANTGNIGMAAPMASFPCGGWRESFFGDLHGHDLDAIEFLTQKNVVIERWLKEWTRKF
jgi:malonate-semialdehyde dehydrogenase (acetylating)/methylmalonate-semialdehyde dehydrogenase